MNKPPQLQVEERAWRCAVSDCESDVLRKTAKWMGGWKGEYSTHKCETVEDYAKMVRELAMQRITLYDTAQAEYEKAEAAWKKNMNDHFTMMVWKDEVSRCANDLMQVVGCDDANGGKNHKESFSDYARRLIASQIEALKRLAKAREEMKKVEDKILANNLNNKTDSWSPCG